MSVTLGFGCCDVETALATAIQCGSEGTVLPKKMTCERQAAAASGKQLASLHRALHRWLPFRFHPVTPTGIQFFTTVCIAMRLHLTIIRTRKAHTKTDSALPSTSSPLAIKLRKEVNVLLSTFQALHQTRWHKKKGRNTLAPEAPGCARAPVSSMFCSHRVSRRRRRGSSLTRRHHQCWNVYVLKNSTTN